MAKQKKLFDLYRDDAIISVTPSYRWSDKIPRGLLLSATWGAPKVEEDKDSQYGYSKLGQKRKTTKISLVRGEYCLDTGKITLPDYHNYVCHDKSIEYLNLLLEHGKCLHAVNTRELSPAEYTSLGYTTLSLAEDVDRHINIPTYSIPPKPVQVRTVYFIRRVKDLIRITLGASLCVYVSEKLNGVIDAYQYNYDISVVAYESKLALLTLGEL